MAEIRVNATGGLKLFDADDSHYAQIIAGTITSNVDAITLGHDTVTIADNLSLGSDSAVLKFGADGDTTLTHTDGTGLTLNSTNKLCFNDASQFVQGSSNAILSLGATDEIDLTATAIDINGTCDISGTFSLGGTNITTTAAEINLIDGGTSRGTTAIADGDGVLINDAGTMRMTTVQTLATYIGGGITEADTWRITSSFTGNANPITDNWERDDTAGFGLLGTGMSESSGIFTFPSTGYWLVGFNSTFYGGASENLYVLAGIHVTTDNSSYAEGSLSYGNTEGSNWQNNANVSKMVDVTNTTNVKVRFVSTSQDNNHIANADTSVNYNYATFIKLADT